MLDQLIGPLSAHINGILSQPVTGTDDQVMHVDTKRAYITLLNNIMASKLHGIFTSARTYNWTALLATRYSVFIYRKSTTIGVSIGKHATTC